MRRLAPFLISSALVVASHGCHEDTVANESPIPPPRPDAGSNPSQPVLSGGASPAAAELSVAIDVGGIPAESQNLECGQCIDVTAVASGGRAPYSYAWSDPSLSGSGPHHVCPRSTVDYVVQASDTPPLGELRRDSLRGVAQLHVDVGPCTSTLPPPSSTSGVGAKMDAGSEHVPTTRPMHDAGSMPPHSRDGGQVADASSPTTSDAGATHRICPCSNAASWTEYYFMDPSFESTSTNSRTVCTGTPTVISGGPGTAADGSSYYELSLPSSFTETLSEPLSAASRYWMSFDMASTSQITASTGIPLGAVDIFGASLTCTTGQLLAEQTFRPTDSSGWIHVCIEFVPLRDYPYVVISAQVANGVGTGSVKIDGLRVGWYEPSLEDYILGICSFEPLNQPFP
jgi:hypothetical protein